MAYTKINLVSSDTYGYASTFNKVIQNIEAILGSETLPTTLKNLLDLYNTLQGTVNKIETDIDAEIEAFTKNINSLIDNIIKENDELKKELNEDFDNIDSRLYKLIDSTGYKSSLYEYFNDDKVKPINRYRVVSENKYYDLINNNWIEYIFPNKNDIYDVTNPKNIYELVDNDISNPTFDQKYKWVLRTEIKEIADKTSLDKIPESTDVYKTLDESKYYRYINKQWTEIKKNTIATKKELDDSIVVSGEVLNKVDLPDAIGYKRRNLALAINKLLDDLGYVSKLTTTHKTTAVGAINELDAEIGDMSTISTVNNLKQSTVVATFNKVNEIIGDLSALSTVNGIKLASIVLALNKLNTVIGNVSTISATNTENKVTDVVSTYNKLDAMIGKFTTLHTQIKDTTIIASLNKLNTLLGLFTDITDSEIKAVTFVATINNIKKIIGNIVSLCPTNSEFKGASICETLVKYDTNLFGKFSEINVQIKGNTYKETFNKINDLLGNISSISDSEITANNISQIINNLKLKIGAFSNLFSTNTTNKDTDLVKSLNKLDTMLGLFTDIDTYIKGTTYTETFNNIKNKLGEIEVFVPVGDNLSNKLKKFYDDYELKIADLSAKDKELNTEIDTVRGTLENSITHVENELNQKIGDLDLVSPDDYKDTNIVSVINKIITKVTECNQRLIAVEEKQTNFEERLLKVEEGLTKIEALEKQASDFEIRLLKLEGAVEAELTLNPDTEQTINKGEFVEIEVSTNSVKGWGYTLAEETFISAEKIDNKLKITGINITTNPVVVTFIAYMDTENKLLEIKKDLNFNVIESEAEKNKKRKK